VDPALPFEVRVLGFSPVTGGLDAVCWRAQAFDDRDVVDLRVCIARPELFAGAAGQRLAAATRREAPERAARRLVGG
jgi:hypothetical protein